MTTFQIIDDIDYWLCQTILNPNLNLRLFSVSKLNQIELKMFHEKKNWRTNDKRCPNLLYTQLVFLTKSFTLLKFLRCQTLKLLGSAHKKTDSLTVRKIKRKSAIQDNTHLFCSCWKENFQGKNCKVRGSARKWNNCYVFYDIFYVNLDCWVIGQKRNTVTPLSEWVSDWVTSGQTVSKRSFASNKKVGRSFITRSANSFIRVNVILQRAWFLYQMVTQKYARTCQVKVVIWSVEGICLHWQKSQIWNLSKRPVFLHACTT